MNRCRNKPIVITQTCDKFIRGEFCQHGFVHLQGRATATRYTVMLKYYYPDGYPEFSLPRWLCPDLQVITEWSAIIWRRIKHMLWSWQSPDLKPRLWSDISQSSNTNWGNIFIKTAFHSSSTVPETCKIFSNLQWSCSGGLLWASTLLTHFVTFNLSLVSCYWLSDIPATSNWLRILLRFLFSTWKLGPRVVILW